MRRLVAVVAACGSIVGASAVASAHPAPGEALARYSYVGHRAAILVVTGSVDIGPGAVFATVSADLTDRSHPSAFFPTVIDLSSSDAVRTYGATGNRTLCPPPLTCSVSGGKFSFQGTFGVAPGRQRSRLREWVALRGQHAVIHDAGFGWTARQASTGLLTRSDRDAAGVGVDTDGLDLGAMTSVSAPGADGGSVAIAVPACDMAGAGLWTLDGGAESQSALCPSDAIAAYAPGQTTWSATGAVVGASESQTRLVVLPA